MTANENAATSTATKQLGRYQIVKHLAQGGMADVLLARTTGIEGFERHVVIKRIRAEQARDQRYVSMFLDEARLAASLHHHNVVQVNDIGEVDGEFFFAMEYVHGEDVRALLTQLSTNDQHIPFEHIITIVTAAAAGLHHAHEQRAADRTPLGIVHRDVSPANILIGYDGSVKVADFGIAKAAQRTTETKSGTLKGKVAYMSPEQCVGEAVDRRSDVFSLGIVLYELCTVRRLFKGENDFLTMTSIVLGHIPSPLKYRLDLPPELEDIIMKALANKPSERYQSADEMRLALEKYAASAGLRTSSTSLADYVKQQFGQRPEPWLDEEEPDFELSIDFDGSASGVVQPPMEAMMSFALPERGSEATPIPLAKARNRAITEGMFSRGESARAETEMERPAGAVIELVASQRKLPAAVIVEPSSPEQTQPTRTPARSRRVWWLSGVIAVISIGASLALVVPGNDKAAPRQTKRAPAASVKAAPVVAPTPVPAPAAAAPVVVKAAPVAPVAAPPAKAKKVRKKVDSKSEPKPRWDPNALFPE